ncbi:MAG: class I SAM-dependent methyltransferase family protein [Methanimicrococcus sp.]|nr:class I SAM-dependent methyltransferase family protein [Methanimicrococcus sp.]
MNQKSELKEMSDPRATEQASDGNDCVLRASFRIHKDDGEPIRRLLDEFELIDHSCKPFADDIYLYLPLIRYPEKEERLAFRDRLMPIISLLPHPKKKMEYYGWYLKDVPFQVQKKVPTVYEILGYSVAYEVIGDIAVIDDRAGGDENLKDGVSSFNVSDIADAVLTTHSAVKTVLLSAGQISGEFRTRPLEFVKGENKTATVHKEYGCKYRIDLARAFFTPRLSTERRRISEQVQDGDVVIDMFAGVGPYSIAIAKNASSSCVIANDKNEDAFSLLRENIALNKVSNIVALNEDALFLSEKYAGAGDHVIMNLPHNAFDFLDTAVAVCKPGGVIHYYAMAFEDDLFDGSVELIRKAAEKQDRFIEVVEKRTVRSYAPHQYNICLDVRIL